MQSVSLKDHLEEVLADRKDALTLKYLKSVHVNILKA